MLSSRLGQLLPDAIIFAFAKDDASAATVLQELP